MTLSVSAIGAENYEWKKDGKAITDSKCSGTDGPILIINEFSTDDQGEYSCVIRNRDGEVESKSANMALGNNY